MQNALHSIISVPDAPAAEEFTNAADAVERLISLYQLSARFLCDHFQAALVKGDPGRRIRAYYPEISVTTKTHAQVDSRLSFGHVTQPGTHKTTVTRPDLFKHYLCQQIGLLLENHKVPVTIGMSSTPMPVHFAVANDSSLSVPQQGGSDFVLRDVFDVPDLTTTNDDIMNGTFAPSADGAGPLAPFTAQRVDYSLARLAHYTATDPSHFQNHVLFTNYQFYVSEFEAYARAQLAD
ncbi:MAG: AMP nucleosidase, partial [Rhodobacteraceae bacterium]|nr:AMP nucleosidase [Paracoccaceae bacterium]